MRAGTQPSARLPQPQRNAARAGRRRFAQPAIVIASVPRSEGRLPFLIFCAYTAVLIGRPQDFLPALATLRPALVLSVVALIVTLLVRRSGEPSPFRHHESRLYMAFYFIMLAGVPFSIYRRESFDFATQAYIINIVFYLLFLMHVNTIDRFKEITVVLVLTLLLFAGLGLRGGTFLDGRYFILTSMFDPNDIAFVLISLLPFALCVLLGPFHGLTRVIATVSIVAGVVLALYTGSRGGLLGFTTLFLLFLVVRVRRVTASRKLVMLALVVIAGAANSDKINVERYLTLTNVTGDYNATEESGRSGIWRRGLQLFADNPITGVGVGRFGEAIGTTRLGEDIVPQWQAPHNSYLQVLTEIGIFGAGVFLLLILASVKGLASFKANPGDRDGESIEIWSRVLLLGFLAQLFTAFFLSQGYSIFLTLSFAAAVSLKQLSAANRSTRTTVGGAS